MNETRNANEQAQSGSRTTPDAAAGDVRSAILATIPSTALGRPLFVESELPSTSDRLRELAEAGAPEGTAVIALAQTRGRGRREHRWHSPCGRGLYISVLLRPAWPVHAVSSATAMAAWAVVRVLRERGLQEAVVRPPNDVFVRGRKIAGILVEPRIGHEGIAFVVLGVGLNLSQTAEDWEGTDLEHSAVSCRQEGVRLALHDAATALLRTLDALYDADVAPRQEDILVQAAHPGGMP